MFIFTILVKVRTSVMALFKIGSMDVAFSFVTLVGWFMNDSTPVWIYAPNNYLTRFLLSRNPITNVQVIY